MQSDYDRYAAALTRDGEGNPANALRLDNFEFTDEERMGKRLQELTARTNTHDEYVRVGEIYGFPVSIISERCVKDGVESVQNRFVVEGQYKYKFNNGYIAMSDAHTACMNFLNALERIPEIIRQHQERKAKAEKDVPALQVIVDKV